VQREAEKQKMDRARRHNLYHYYYLVVAVARSLQTHCIRQPQACPCVLSALSPVCGRNHTHPPCTLPPQTSRVVSAVSCKPDLLIRCHSRPSHVSATATAALAFNYGAHPKFKKRRALLISNMRPSREFSLVFGIITARRCWLLALASLVVRR
jgi:hypothetical protein